MIDTAVVPDAPPSAVAGPRGRQALGRALRRFSRSPTLIALALIVLAGSALRLWLMLRWRPAFVGFPDTAVYIVDAKQGLFADPLRISGYALFLRLLHAISPQLSLVTLVQHGMGIASGLLLFDAMRRAKLPIGLGLVPAAVTMLGGSELFLEHAPLTESVFIFLVALALWFIVLAWMGRAWWSLAAGLCLGCAAIDRSVGQVLLPVALACLLFTPRTPSSAARPGALGRRGAAGRVVATLRRHRLATTRALRVALALLAALATIVPFAAAHHSQTGSWGFTSNGYLDLYARVAPWANCTKFTPPKGTAVLCPTTPVSQRPGNNDWEFTGISPAVTLWGAPEWFGPKPPKDENGKLKSFAVAAIEGQPLTYLEWVGRDLVRIVDPSFTTSPYPAIGNNGYGFTPEQQLDYYTDLSNIGNIDNIVASYYHTVGGKYGNVKPLVEWERATRLEGPVMAAALLLALLAPLLATGLSRRIAITCGLFTLVLLAAPVFAAHYEYRFVVPAFGVLTAASAIGGYELWRRIQPRGSALYRRVRPHSR